MIACHLNGRLGNNLLQIATGLSLAKKLNTELILPRITYAGHRGPRPVDLSIFNYEFTQVDNVEMKTTYNEVGIKYTNIEAQDDTIIIGDFSSWKYFEDIKYELLNKYYTPSPKVKARLENYHISDKALGISVRRGDFLMLQHNHCVLSTAYYQNVLNTYFQDNIDTIYIFSDDIEWCQGVFGESVHYVQDDIGTQLFLMSRMKHLILSNSTFAWWGGYLNQNKGVIVAPDPWLGPAHDDKDLSDLYYPGWILHKHVRELQPFTYTANFYN